MSHKTLTVSLVGAPNAGKSTLLNRLIGQKVAIVTPKQQTTRKNVRGVVTVEQTQLIFVDTPGIFTPSRVLEQKIVRQAIQGFREADYICFIFDAKKDISRDIKHLFMNVTKEQKKAIAVINKVDLLKDKTGLLKIASELSELHEFERIFMISAMKDKGVSDILSFLLAEAPEGEWLFDEHTVTDTTERNLAEEITREQLFMAVNYELPYSIDVRTEQWEEKSDGSAKIHQVIYVLKSSHKPIILGPHGEKLKEIGRRARLHISKILDRPVHLFLYIKVKPDWIDKLSLME